MKKICFLTSSISSVGGVQRVIAILANYLCEDYEVDIVVTTDEPFQNIYNLDKRVSCKYLSMNGAVSNIHKVLRKLNQKTRGLDHKLFMKLAANSYYPVSVQEKMINFINKNNYDVVIGSESYFILLLGIIKNKISAKTVGWQHSTFDSYFLQRGRHFGSVKQLTKKYLPFIDKYIVLTTEDKKLLDQYLSLNTVIIHNPLSFKSSKKTNLKNKRIVFIGRLVPMKGIEDLIESFSKLSYHYPEWTVSIYGDGPHRKVLEKLITNKGLIERVFLEGQTSEVSQVLIKSDLLVLPSRWEGFGMVILEALECGVPVIAYKSSGPCEIIENEKNGLLIENSNIDELTLKLESLMADEKQLEDLSMYGIQSVKRYYPQSIISEWKKILEGVCD